jgi:flavin reductase (DIM6/NTAB) family NADH-FMN oxidoreductase RutF
MVSVGDMESSNIITIGWTGILSTIPPRTYISVRPQRHSYGIIKRTGEFVINLTTADQARIVDYAGIYTGAKVDKFKECGLTKAESKEVSAPTIAECPIALECRVCEIIPMGSHDVFMADILSVSCREDIIDEAGKMHFDKADLLAYAHGEYYSLGEVVGRFGFSTDKPKAEEKTPFYKSAPRGKSPKKKPTDKNKGAPHGRRAKK